MSEREYILVETLAKVRAALAVMPTGLDVRDLRQSVYVEHIRPARDHLINAVMILEDVVARAREQHETNGGDT